MSNEEQLPPDQPAGTEGAEQPVVENGGPSQNASFASESADRPSAEATEPSTESDAASTGAVIDNVEEFEQVASEPTSASVSTDDPIVAAKISELEELAGERTADLQRLQAEYANYKKRVDRDRALARQGGIEAVVLDLLPVLDSIEAAREHDELTGGFKLVAEELERMIAKYGLSVYGEVGEIFDPNVHEALMQVPMPGVEVTTVSAVMQKGVRLNERVLRPARVGVAQPE